MAMVRCIVPFSDFEMRHWLSAFSSARRACSASIVGGMLRRARTSNAVNCGALSILSSVPLPRTAATSRTPGTPGPRLETSARSTLPPPQQEAFPGTIDRQARRILSAAPTARWQGVGGELDVIERVASGDYHVSVGKVLHGRFVA